MIPGAGEGTNEVQSRPSSVDTHELAKVATACDMRPHGSPVDDASVVESLNGLRHAEEAVLDILPSLLPPPSICQPVLQDQHNLIGVLRCQGVVSSTV